MIKVFNRNKILFICIFFSIGILSALFAQEEERDIETASFYELTDWLRQLGLNESGNRQALEERLRQYYGIREEADQEPASVESDEPAETPDEAAEATDEAAEAEDPVSSLQIITIESAHEAQAMTLDVVDEEFIRLSGDVVLRVKDEKTGDIHRLEASVVEFNQKEKRLVARGGVMYQQEGSDDTEKTFHAQEISFQIENWGGLFIQGKSERSRKIEDQDILFYFMGDRIYTADKDIIILEKGTITSSNPDDPYYRIDANKIWLLGPGEWGLSHGVLRIGRIPVFYLPFFYNPGDEMVINPVIGYRVKEGSYIQTTTYLQGRKKEDESALSFMKIAGDSGRPREQKLVGLYLRQQDEFLDKEDPGYFKIMADYYSNLGIFTGFEGDWKKIPLADSLFFSFGLARSRNIYASGTTGLYSPYDTLAGEDTSVWHEMTLPWGDAFPYRWGVKFTGKWKLGDLTMEHYSDPSYNRDFFDRAETFNWIDYLYRKEPEQSSSENEISAFLWKFQSRWTVPLPQFFKPYINTLSLSQFSTQLSWQSRTNPDFIDDDPRSSFYYVDSGEFPSLRLSLSGELFRYPFTDRAAQVAEARESKLIPPWHEEDEDPEEENLDEEESESSLLEPEYLTTKTAGVTNQYFSANLGYSLYSQQNYSAKTDSDEWVALEDVKYQPDLALYNTVNNIDMNGKMNFFNSSLALSNSSNLNHRYRDHYNLSSYEEPQWDTLLLGDYNYNKITVTNKFLVQVFPLRWLKWFEKSVGEYKFNNQLWNRTFQEMRGETPLYEEIWYDATQDMVSAHESSFSLIFAPADQSQTLKYRHVFKPLELTREFSLNSGYKNEYWATQLTNSLKYFEEEWDWDNIKLSLNLTPWEVFNVSNSLQYDPEEKKFPENKTSLVLGPFQGFLDFADAPVYFWDDATKQWEAEEGTQFHLTKITSKISWQPEGYYFWFNRIFVKPKINGQMYFNMDKINDSALTVDGGLIFRIAEFIDLNLSVKSSNTFIYRYLPNVSEETFGIPSLDPVEDLLYSFDFFNWLSEDSRESSHFNMESLSFELVHHLVDWDLHFIYSAAPELKTDDNLIKYYEWIPTFSILVQWNPIPEIITKLSKDDDGWEIKSRQD